MRVFIVAALIAGGLAPSAKAEPCEGPACPEDPAYDRAYPTAENGLFS